MDEKPVEREASHSFSKQLIMVLEHNELIGTRLVRLIRQATPFQAILAKNRSEARTILTHLKCDVVLLTDDPFPDEDLERLSLASLRRTSSAWDPQGVRSISNVVNLLLAFRGGPSSLSSDEKNQ